MTTHVSMTFDVGCCNGSMHVDIQDQQRQVAQPHELAPGQHTVSFDIEWPTVIHIELTNRHPQDTVQDQQGTILANKYIQLHSMSINGAPVTAPTLYNISQYTPRGEAAPIQETFWDRNGTVTIALDHANPLRWMLTHSNTMELRNNDQH